MSQQEIVLDIITECAYCGAELMVDREGSGFKGEEFNVVVEWDHTCTMPPPLISSQLGED